MADQQRTKIMFSKKLVLKDIGDIDNPIKVRTKTLLLWSVHDDDDHILNDLLENHPLGI